MQNDTGNRFASFLLDPEEETHALQVSPYFIAYLQNKLAAYAGSLVDLELPYHSNPSEQVAAIVQLERRRAFVKAYEELLAEIFQAQQATNQPEK